MSKIKIDDYLAQVGTLERVSNWVTVDQELIDMFANATHDHQFIHVDIDKANHTPFKGTIAHGFLSLSLLSGFIEDCMPGIEGAVMSINYGFEKIRFLAPVPSGSKLRGKFKLIESTERNSGEYLSKFDVAVEIGGSDKPALVAEWLTLAILRQ